jgi:hypothetical protein
MRLRDRCPLTEPDVALTDFLLSLEAGLFAVLLWRSGPVDSDLRLPFVVFFAATALSALTGGIVHGFFTANYTTTGVALWRLALIAVGVGAVAMWAIGARLLLPASAARTLLVVVTIVAVAYAITVAAVSDDFRIAIAHYLPPTLFLLFAFAAVYQRDRRLPLLAGVVGMVLTLVAAFVQQRKIALHPVYFNHNALYHAIQAVGLFLIYLTGRGLVQAAIRN